MAALPPFQALLDEHGAAVWRFLRASLGEHDAADCYQETVLSALRAYPSLRRADNLKSWLFTIAHHKAIDHHRRVARRREADGVAPRAGRRPRPSRSTRRCGPRSPACPTKQRLAVLQRYVADLAYAEIAEILDCTEAAARQNVRAGLASLRTQPRQGAAAMTSDPLVTRLAGDRSGPPVTVVDRVRAAAEAEGLVDVAWTTTDSPVGAAAAGRHRRRPHPDRASAATTSILEELAAKVSPRVLEAPARLDAVRRQLDEYFAGAPSGVRPADRPVAVVGLLPPGARGALRGALRAHRPLRRPRPHRRQPGRHPGGRQRHAHEPDRRSSSPATGCSPPTARSATTPAASSASRPSSPWKAPSSSEADRYASSGPPG